LSLTTTIEYSSWRLCGNKHPSFNYDTPNSRIFPRAAETQRLFFILGSTKKLFFPFNFLQSHAYLTVRKSRVKAGWRFHIKREISKWEARLQGTSDRMDGWTGVSCYHALALTISFFFFFSSSLIFFCVASTDLSLSFLTFFSLLHIAVAQSLLLLPSYNHVYLYYNQLNLQYIGRVPYFSVSPAYHFDCSFVH
jgi:hypothetical protein